MDARQVAETIGPCRGGDTLEQTVLKYRPSAETLLLSLPTCPALTKFPCAPICLLLLSVVRCSIMFLRPRLFTMVNIHHAASLLKTPYSLVLTF
jgi:hypothetical protein